MIRSNLPQAVPGHPSPVVISYLRFSNASQAAGDSIRRQTKRTDEWSERTGIPIDASLSLRDSGVSAFRGKNATRGALADFLEMIEAGRVWPGCYLSIENLDRLSRQEPLESVALVQRILRAGVRIVVHSPSETIYDERSAGEPHALFLMISEFIRANQESQRKSDLLSQSWTNKRAIVVTDQIKLTARCPWWLEPIRDGHDRVTGYNVLKERAEIANHILRLCIDGHGNTSICRTLNESGVPTIGKSSRWATSTVNKLLHDRSLIGEYQPHKMVDGKREPIGDPIADYFPAIVDETTFYKAQAAIVDRSLPRGKHALRVQNLFTGLMFDARDGASMDVINKGTRSIGPAIVNSDARLGKDAVYLAFPYGAFETAVLSLITEIDLGLVMPRKVTGIGKAITNAAKEVDTIEGRILAIKAKIKSNPKSVGPMLDLLTESNEELDQAKDRLEQLKRQQSTPASHGLASAKELVKRLAKAKAAERVEIRTKIRSVIRQFVRRITILTVQVNSDRVLMADIELASGKHRKIALETGVPAPDAFYKLDVRKWSQWPEQWRVERLTVVSDDEQRALALDDKGRSLEEIAGELGCSTTKVSRILKKHGRARITNRKPRDSDVLMTWNKAANGWQKSKDKQRFYIGCGELKKLYPRLVKSLDREGTLKAANRWWQEKLKEIEG